MTLYRPGLLALPLLAVALCRVAAGQEPPSPCPGPSRPVPGVAWWAVPSDTGRYVGYPVGGGCLHYGDAPAPDEGTWGWDYGGFLLHPRIKLLWCRHCGSRREVPAYRTVGPKPHKSPSSP